MLPVLLYQGDQPIKMHLVRHCRHGGLKKTVLDRLDRRGQTTWIHLGRLGRHGQKAEMVLVRLIQGRRTTETNRGQLDPCGVATMTYRVQPILPVRMMGWRSPRGRTTEMDDQLNPNSQMMGIRIGPSFRPSLTTKTRLIRLGRCDLTIKNFLDRPYRRDRLIGTYLVDRTSRIGMTGANGKKNPRELRN
jgi:hypothetical protein